MSPTAAHRLRGASRRAAALVGTLGVLASCAPTPPPALPPPLEAALEGCVGILTGSAPTAGPAGDVPRPLTPAEAAAKGTAAGALGPIAYGALFGGPLGLVVGVLLAPGAAVVGGAWGAASGVSREVQERNVAAIQGAIEDWEPGPAIAGAILAEPCRPRLVVCDEAGPCTAPDGNAPSAVVAVLVHSPRFAVAEPGIDPELALDLDTRVEVRDGTSGAVLERWGFGFTGRPATLTELGRDEARLLRGQLDEAAARIGQGIARSLLGSPARGASP